MTYVQNLQKAGVDAHADVFHGDMHAFDALFWTGNAKEAHEKLSKAYEKIIVNGK